MTRRLAGAVVFAIASAGCGHAIFVPPSTPGATADASSAWAEATASCKDAGKYSGALRISGRAGAQRIWRLSLETALTPNSIYMNATVAGNSLFVLAGSSSDATLWLRREQRVVKAPAADIIEAILGLSMPPDRLLALLTGCGSRRLEVKSATSHPNLLVVDTPDGRVFLKRQASVWRTLGAEAEGFRVEFSWKTSPLPEKIWIRSSPGREPAATLDISVDDASITDEIPATVFNAPSGASNAEPMTLEELRSGSWRKRD